MNFANIKEITIPEGKVATIIDAQGKVLWQKISPLPHEYQQVEWVQADASVGAYIDLGFTFDTSAVIKIKQYIVNDNAAYVFGAVENSGVLRCCLTSPMFTGASLLYGSSGTTYNRVSTSVVTDFNEIIMTLRPSYISIENITTNSSSSITTQAAYTMSSNLFLFAQNYNGAARFGDIRRIAYFKYYDRNNRLICNLVPCYRKSDGTVGMYDLSRRIFLTNIGTGNFTAGPVILPEEYQQVEWIQADAYADTYIDLGFTFDRAATIYLGQDVVDINHIAYVFGATEQGNIRCCLSSPYQSNGACLNGCQSITADGITTNVVFADVVSGLNEMILTLRQGYIAIENTTTNDFESWNIQAEYTMSSNLYLFAQNYDGTVRVGDIRRVAYFKYYDYDNNLICDLVPCYRKSDGVIGMYDLIRKIFLTNAGTENFSIGPVVLPTGYKTIEYIGLSGSQGIIYNEPISSVTEISMTFAPTEFVSSYVGGTYLDRNSSNRTGYMTWRESGSSKLLESYVNADNTNIKTPPLTANQIYTVTDKADHLSSEHSFKTESNGHTLYTATEEITRTISATNESLPFGIGCNGYLAISGGSGAFYQAQCLRGNIYNFKHKRDNIFIHDFVPCRRELDGIIGMYDVITKTFYTNAGEGDFTTNSAILPDEYQQVEYIEADGNEYINTKIVSSNYSTGIKYKMKCNVSEYQTGTRIYWFGNAVSSSNARSGNLFADDNYIGLMVGASTTNYYYIERVPVGQDIEIIAEGTPKNADQFSVTVNGTQMSKTGTITNGNMPEDTIYFLTARHTTVQETPGKQFIGKVYGFTMLDTNGVLLRYYIPCYRKTDGVIGFYDIVSKTLFTNIGTGSFQKGPDV